MAEEGAGGVGVGRGGGAHVVIFPLPLPAHVGSMLKLAELLVLEGIHVTFLITESNHKRLLRFGDIESLSACYPTFHLKVISDGYHEGDHPGSGDRVGEVIPSITRHAKPFLLEILVSAIPKVTCIIQDGIFGELSTAFAAQLRIPLIHFRTISACCFWAYFCVPDLLHSKQLPIRGDDDMDRMISNMPGMENLLRCRDLPSFCRPGKENFLNWAVSRTRQSREADVLILNTSEDLEGPVLSQIRLHFPKVYTIGPLHHLLNLRKASDHHHIPKFRNSLFQVDKSCMAWLDAQPQGSVIYVSFGSSTIVKRQDLMEIWHGLVNSNKRFLWVMRPDIIPGKGNHDRIPVEVEEGTRERGFIVGWAPQEEVLAHKAIGGFMTHSGWNSTLDSVVAGVPMICWPYFADQQINSRFVAEVWKLGLDMKDECDRQVVENMVNDLMVHRKEEFLRSAQQMAMLAHKSISPSGSSYHSLQDFIRYIKCAGQENN
ncbi:hypothetical protein Fmac_003006 [Flemingia macrophylla]|uniref:Glycosyltransferase n=1 Tax=Flemingia macrophylla TaxID=520843 RepID=A0ABD1NM73_9FABA